MIDKILGTYMFPSRNHEEKWDIEKEDDQEEGIVMFDGEKEKLNEKEEELLIDFGDVAELDAGPVPTTFGQPDTKNSTISSTMSYSMNDLLGSSPPTPTETIMSTTTTSMSTTEQHLLSDSTKSPSVTITTNTLTTPNTTRPSSPSPSYHSCSEDEGGIQMIDNDDDIDMYIQISVPETISTLALNEAETLEKGMSGLAVTERSIDDVKRNSSVEPKSLGSLSRAGKKSPGDFGLF